MKSGEKVSEVDLAKVEKVIADGTMPPAKYFMAHWGAYINAKEKASEMRERVTKSESYEDALEIIREYVDIIES